MVRTTTRVTAIAGLVLVFLASSWACRAPASPQEVLVSASSGHLEASGHTIVLGDIDADEPAKKIRGFQPLADYLGENLGDYGIKEGRVVIARDVAEMGRLLQEGRVDVYMDSPFPALAVQELSGSEFILRRWKSGVPEYWSTFVALRDNGITGVEDFVGKTLAFEEVNSTSGFLMPVGTLIQRGFKLKEVRGPAANAGPGVIGYRFSRDEENTFELVLTGQVAGGGISIDDYKELPGEMQDRLTTFDRTITVPRQIVSVRPGLEPGLAGKVRELLIGLDQTEEGRQILEGIKKSKFDALPPESGQALEELKELIRLASGGS